MPGISEEITEAEYEGVEITYLVTPVRLLGKDGKVRGIECVRNELGEYDAGGRRRPVPIEGSEFLMDVDTVIVAIGEIPELLFLAGNSEFELTKEGTLVVDADTLETPYPGVFAGGDVVGGPGTVVDSIAAGQKAAAIIAGHLQGEVISGTSAESIDASSIKVEIPKGIEIQERQKMPVLELAERRHSFKEVHLGFTEESALLEAKRCLNCAGHLCKEVCPFGAPQFEPGEDAKMRKCDFCLDRLQKGRKPKCVIMCPESALDYGPLDELLAKYGDIEEPRSGFPIQYSRISKPSVIFQSEKDHDGNSEG